MAEHGSLTSMPEQIIHLHRDALPKPPEGEPCNGCGVCCALETCPAARLRFLQRHGPCPALTWNADEARYRCGLLMQPRHYLGGLPLPESLLQRLFARWIAVGHGCDCSADAGNAMESDSGRD